MTWRGKLRGGMMVEKEGAHDHARIEFLTFNIHRKALP
jgi:hypothetical protein